MDRHRRAGRRGLLLGAVTLGLAVLGAAPALGHNLDDLTLPSGASTPAAPGPVADQIGPDYVASGDVEFIRHIPYARDGVGARIVGDHLYLTTTKDLEIFDISTPEDPQLVSITPDVEFENEEVPTNGTILGISGQIGCADPTSANVTNPDRAQYGSSTSESTGCLSLYDVRDPSAPTRLVSVAGSGQHTSTCITDLTGTTTDPRLRSCGYFWGSGGAVTYSGNVLKDPSSAHPVGNWKAWVADEYGVEFRQSCHNQREVRPGLVIAACQPILLLSTDPRDGASPIHPVLLARGENADERFIHSARWPREGKDKFALIGGETNFEPQCGDANGAFMTWDASHALARGPAGPGKAGRATGKLTMIDEYRVRNGAYLDGSPPVNALGCSVHWYAEHPTFKDGGLVALAAYENGTRFLRIDRQGIIHEVGFFEPLSGSTSATHWAPNSRVLYAVDYGRGLDVLRWNGPLFAPPKP